MLEIVVRLLRRAEGIAVHEDLEPAQSCHLDDLHQRDAAAVQARRQLRARGHLEEVEGNGATAGADHGQAAPPREGRDRGGEGRVHSHAIQDERRPDSAGELANLVRGVRTTRDDVVGAVLASQLQSGFGRVDGDDSCAGQLAKELNRIEAQTADADHDRGAARPDRREAPA